jgi:hydrogenase maturation factor
VNLQTGKIVEVYAEGGMTLARVRIGGVFIRISIDLLPEAKVGNHIFIAGGVALALVAGAPKKELSNVLGHSRKSVAD